MAVPMDKTLDFIRQIVEADLQQGRVGKIVTRFPPEPNGYLHIGHAKAISLNFDLVNDYGGKCYLRMDDTNPEGEAEDYVNAICEDIQWLGYQWGDDNFRYASDYFELMCKCARYLIENKLAYVDHLSNEEVNSYRGSPLQKGRDSPWRDRPIEENRQLFEQMCNGILAEGKAVLRAKVDMQHVNVHMRDPIIYRIKHVGHHRQGKRWHIYPMYDFAHPLEDAFEGVSHSLCSLEFENHRQFYQWLLQALKPFLRLSQEPQQYEFSRLNISNTVLSKRSLKRLVDEGYVSGWDDIRMPTLRGLRRRGIPAAALLSFVRAVGVTKSPSLIDVQFLHHHVREYLNSRAARRMAILEPLRICIDNYPAGKSEEITIENQNGDQVIGCRKLRFSRDIWIEQSDFLENPPKGYFRLAPGSEVRLKGAYFIRCLSVDYHSDGSPALIHCHYDPDSAGGSSPDGRKVKGTIHWLDCHSAVAAEFHLADNLFSFADVSELEEGEDLLDHVNPSSLTIKHGFVEPNINCNAAALQFIRLGYFVHDLPAAGGKAVRFNRVVTLKDRWSRQNQHR